MLRRRDLKWHNIANAYLGFIHALFIPILIQFTKPMRFIVHRNAKDAYTLLAYPHVESGTEVHRRLLVAGLLNMTLLLAYFASLLWVLFFGGEIQGFFGGDIQGTYFRGRHSHRLRTQI